MNYIALILVGVAGVVLGAYFACPPKLQRRRAGRRGGGAQGGGGDGLIAEQAKQKEENKEKIVAFVREKGEIQNNDVEKLVGVSNATAERYLDELEKEGVLIQHGKIGQGVFYTLK